MAAKAETLPPGPASTKNAKVVSIEDGLDWEARLLTYGTPPTPRPILHNALIALEYAPTWRDVLVYNEFSHEVFLERPAPWGGKGERPWTDNDDRLAARWFQEQQIFISTQLANEAIKTRAQARTINPVLNFLQGLEWDGWARVDTWLHTYLGVPLTDYSAAVGRAWMISAVARAFDPGCKADHCLILEGPQGKGKSTALQTLAGKSFFTDYVSDNLASKEASILCAGVWVIEFSELEGIAGRSSRVEAVKAFLSRTHDRYRPHYARHPISIPRQCVFAATTNREVYLSDESGNRRFWPVTCGRIDLRGLERDRAQLWAEACALYFDNQPWWLERDYEQLASKEQSSRLEVDAWQTPVERYLKGKTDTTLYDVLTDSTLRRDPGLISRADQMRVAKILALLGWKQVRVGKSGVRRYRPA